MTEDEILALPYRPCVGLMVVNADGLIWAGQRKDAPEGAPPAWQMPQGGIDPGETPHDAALRELAEETSIPSYSVEILGESKDWLPYDLPRELIPSLWNGKYRGQSQKWFLMRFNGSDSLIDIDTKEPEFSNWAWMRSPELINNIVPFKLEIYTRVFDEFRSHLEA